MSKYIDADKLIAEIESRMEDCKLPDGTFPTTTNIVRYEELSCLRNYITDFLQEQPDVELEKAARNVYESWSGGTMDDVRRDMVELGKVLNARKEV